MASSDPRRILIPTVTAGAGHLQAASALEEAWKLFRPQDIVEKVDVLTFGTVLWRRAYSRGYVQLVEHAPELFAHFFRKSDNPERIKKLTSWRRWSARLMTRKFLNHVVNFRPDAVLCPHFLPLEGIGSLKKAFGKRPPLVVCVITDFEAHALWVEPRVDLYCVPNVDTEARLHVRGIPPAQLAVTGIPISQRFVTIADHAAERTLGRIDGETVPTLLILGGGFGMGPLAEILDELEHVDQKLNLLVVAGKNEALQKQLERRRTRHATRVYGFVTNMEELMAASDLILSKPGGLTSSEALALGKPLLIIHPIPGQEAANSDYLLERGAASKINRIEDLRFRLSVLLKPARLKALAAAAKALGKPSAAMAVCREVMARLPE